MTIVLTVLKIIGVTILIILGVLLLIGCLVMFVPIRYRAEGLVPEKGYMESDEDWKKRTFVTVKITWLLHALSVRVHLPDEHNLYVRLFGIRVIPTKEDLAAGTSKVAGRERFPRLKAALRWIWRKFKAVVRRLFGGGGTALQTPHPTPSGPTPGSQTTIGGLNATFDPPPEVLTPQGEGLKEDEELFAEVEEEEIFTEEELLHKAEENLHDLEHQAEEKVHEFEDEVARRKRAHAEAARRKREAAEERKRQKQIAAARKKRERERRKRLRAEKRAADDRTIFEKLEDVVDKILCTISGVYDKIYMFDRLWNSHAFQEAFAFLKKRLIQLLRAILPRKFQAHAHIGTGDPASVANILAVYGILYPAHRGNLTIDPDFEDKAYDGSFNLKGRIFLFRILFLLMTCYFDQNVRVSLKRIRRLMKSESAMQDAA